MLMGDFLCAVRGVFHLPLHNSKVLDTEKANIMYNRYLLDFLPLRHSHIKTTEI